MTDDAGQAQEALAEQVADPTHAWSLTGLTGEMVPRPPSGDAWVAEAVQAVEESITRLVDEFVAEPFIHRVEHSLHVRLVQLLGGWEHLRGWYQIGGSGFRTKLIHKEWPETRPQNRSDSGSRKRRGSFDLAILTPGQLARASQDQFAYGLIEAPIVIEIGFGYWDEHLAGDYAKLLNSEVQHPYLVHLSRTRSARRVKTESVLAAVGAPVEIAYAWHDLASRKVRYRHLDSREFTEHDYPPGRAAGNDPDPRTTPY